MGAVCKLIWRRSMARGAARARCRVPDPLRIDSHTVPSQRTCHVGWRRTREVRRKLRVVRPPRPPPLPRRAPPSPPQHGSPPPLSSGIRRALSTRGDTAQEAVALRGLALAPPLGSHRSRRPRSLPFPQRRASKAFAQSFTLSQDHCGPTCKQTTSLVGPESLDT